MIVMRVEREGWETKPRNLFKTSLACKFSFVLKKKLPHVQSNIRSVLNELNFFRHFPQIGMLKCISVHLYTDTLVGILHKQIKL